VGWSRRHYPKWEFPERKRDKLDTGTQHRRVEIVTNWLTVPDLEKTKKLVLDVLAADKRIIGYPPPISINKGFQQQFYRYQDLILDRRF
jgi:hypothetical protein